MADDTWEPDGHQEARLQFISTWKDHFPEDRLQSLSMCWSNMQFMGCKYPKEVEKLVNDLESKTTFSKQPKRKGPEKIDFKPASSNSSNTSTSLIKNFVLYEAQDKEEPQNAVSVLYESAQKSKKSLSFVEQPSSTKKGHRSCTVIIDKQIIAVEEAMNKKDAKRMAAEKAIEILRSCQPVIKKRKIDHTDTAAVVNKTQLTKDAYDNATAIPESNLGNQLLRKMGWTGGGVGKKGQGIAEPIMVTGVDGKQGLGQSKVQDLNKESIKQVLVEFISGPEMQLRFSNQLEKKERALIHKISGELGLRHQSYSTGEDRYLIVSKKETLTS